MKPDLIIKEIKSLLVSLCVYVCVKGRMHGLNQILCESMLHVVGQAHYVEGVQQGVVGVDPVFIGGSICKGRLG